MLILISFFVFVLLVILLILLFCYKKKKQNRNSMTNNQKIHLPKHIVWVFSFYNKNLKLTIHNQTISLTPIHPITKLHNLTHTAIINQLHSIILKLFQIPHFILWNIINSQIRFWSFNDHIEEWNSCYLINLTFYV